jgi:hypothetical protein
MTTEPSHNPIVPALRLGAPRRRNGLRSFHLFFSTARGYGVCAIFLLPPFSEVIMIVRGIEAAVTAPRTATIGRRGSHIAAVIVILVLIVINAALPRAATKGVRSALSAAAATAD